MASSRNLGIAVVFLAVAALGAGDPARAGDLERGRKLFDLCTQCHGADGGGDPLSLAPAIAGMGEWYVASQLEKFRSGLRGTHPDDLGGLRMHPMSRWLATDQDVSAVAAYVASLPTVRPDAVLEGGDAGRGAQLYVTCAACHGQDGSGNQALNAPRLTGTSDWYLLTTLQKYKVGVLGGNPLNTNSVLMRGMAAQLVDEQAMRDVIAYISSLPGS
jgi:cytochrome c oxidase subunit 2